MGNRILKINSVVKQDLANYIEINYSGSFISVSNVLCNKDASECTAYLSDYQNDKANINHFIKLLTKKKSRLQLNIARKHNLSKIPMINFKPIDTIDTNLDHLLQIIENERR